MVFKLSGALALAILITLPGRGQSECLPSMVYQADSLLRYHAMLRSAALSCDSLENLEPIIKYYQLFTVNNESKILKSQTLLDHFYNDDDDRSHLRETERQNEQADAIAHAGTAKFCRSAVPALKEAALDSPAEVQATAEDFARLNPGPAKRCN